MKQLKHLIISMLVLFMVGLSFSVWGQPTITSFAPTTGTIGTTVIITGTGFSTTPVNNTVFFGAVKATVSAATANSLTITVPAGAGSIVPISVENGGMLAYSITSTTPYFNLTNTPNLDLTYTSEWIPITGYPLSVVITDFNGDGNADIATGNHTQNNVNIALGNSTGIFGAAYPVNNFAVGNDCSAIATGDFNGDGKPDIAATNYIDNNVSILIGDGLGSFSTAINYAVGTNPTAITIGDIDGDGKADLFIGHHNDTKINVLNGNGDGSFNAATNFNIGSASERIALGDFNGDGKTDLAFANGNLSVGIMLNNGFGFFTVETYYTVGFTAMSVAIGDFDADGNLDIASANMNSNNVSILLGDGLGSFAAATNFAVGNSPRSLAVGDLNGDGKTDLAVTNFSDKSVSILLGDGAGSFAAPTNITFFDSPSSVATGDFNGDGKADIAVSGYTGTVYILLNMPSPELTLSTTTLSAFTTNAGTASIAQTFTVSGAYLTVDAMITAPGSYEVSKDGTTFSNSVTLTQYAGTLIGQPVTIYLRIAASATIGSPAGNFSIASNGATTQTVAVSGTVTIAPSISVTTSLTAFSTTAGTVSVAQTFTVSGADLTADATVTAPGSYEVSKDGTTYTAITTLAQAGGTLTGQPLTIYIRIAASATAGSPSGNVSISSTGAITKNVVVSGTVNDVAPSALSYTSSPIVATIGITNVSSSPTVTGTVVSYSINPALPTGISLNTTTGDITGTPGILSVLTNYTVTATNTGGSTNATFTLTVNNVAPSALSYSSSAVVATIGVTKVSSSPTVTGAVISYSISPALPIGVSLNTTTGEISGIPSVLSILTNYTVTATNTGGSTYATFTLTVNDVVSAPSDLSYLPSSIITVVGTDVTTRPTVTGIGITFTVSPSLPEGLTLDSVTGVISGTPTVIVAETIYIITATNTGGSTNTTLSIKVNSYIAGDTNGDGKITFPEITGDTDGDGTITSPEICGDIDGDGTITSPEIMGDINGNKLIDNNELCGDADASEIIDGSETYCGNEPGISEQITNYMSPNGDGINDTWIVQNVEKFSDYELHIFNNIGETIFNAKAYTNNWDATYKGNQLPSGTYYYIFQKGSSIIKGFISVVR